ncbi:MAG: WD40 repeat domain-containing protein [Candidatus Thermoplasmatota archaeon]|nr:WD40 repeat domain-containing protein [Candidatus Thermoplasmatota archaeon]
MMYSPRTMLFISMMSLLLPSLVMPGMGDPVEIEPTGIEVIWKYTKEDSEATFWKLDWSPDGKLIAATFFDDKCIVLSAEDGTVVRELDTSIPATRCDGFSPEGTNPLRACCFSPDGNYLAVGGDDLVVIVYDTGTWEVKYELMGHTGSILALDFSPDGRYLASGSGTDKVIPQNAGENVTRIWDMVTGREVKVLKGHRDGVLGVKWSHTGERLATCSDDRTLRVYEMPSGMELMNTTGHTSGILDVDWTPDDELLITGSRDYKIKIWNSTTGELRGTWSDHNCVRSVDVHPAGTYAATSGVDLTLKIRDMGTGTELKVVKDGMEQHAMVMSSRWSPDGRYIASGFGISHTVMLYGFGSGERDGSTISMRIVTLSAMLILSILFLILLYYPLRDRIRRRRK